MTTSLQPLTLGLIAVLLNIIHTLKVLVYDPLVWLYDTVFVSSDAVLAKFYTGKTVVITGASSGVGEALALQLATHNCNLVLSARNQDLLNSVAAQCRSISPGSHIHVIALDLEEIGNDYSGAGAGGASAGNGLSKFISTLEKWQNEKGIKGIDVLLNVAGVSSRGSALDTDPATLKKVMDINFFGPVALTRALLPLMLRPRPAAVATPVPVAVGVISSVQGRLGIPLRTSYAASKHALQGYFDCLRAELPTPNVSNSRTSKATATATASATITVISPGYVNTNLSNNAITGDGTKYGKTDDTTARGMSPQLCAQRSLLAIARGLPELVLADAKTCAAVQARGQLPGLLARMVRSKGSSGSSDKST